LGQLPKRLVIGCVDSDALNGAITKKPFNFKHYKINFVALNVDGQQIPANPLQPDFENAGYIRSYMGLSIECQSLAYSLCTVFKQDLSVSIDFDHVVKFCIQDDVDGPCQNFGEMHQQITQTIKRTFGPCGKYGSRSLNGTTLGRYIHRRQLKRGILRPYWNTTLFKGLDPLKCRSVMGMFFQ
jgi:hypothetical protein